METLQIKKQENCRWDAAALGEIMLRFDPGAGRIKSARSFNVWEGGGEYNVIRGLRKCFKLKTAVVTGIPEMILGTCLRISSAREVSIIHTADGFRMTELEGKTGRGLILSRRVSECAGQRAYQTGLIQQHLP